MASEPVFRRANVDFSNHIESFFHTGFSHDREAHLFYDDTCIVPERLEGKTCTFELLKGEFRNFADNLGGIMNALGLASLIISDVHIVSCVAF